MDRISLKDESTAADNQKSVPNKITMTQKERLHQFQRAMVMKDTLEHQEQDVHLERLARNRAENRKRLEDHKQNLQQKSILRETHCADVHYHQGSARPSTQHRSTNAPPEGNKDKRKSMMDATAKKLRSVFRLSKDDLADLVMQGYESADLEIEEYYRERGSIRKNSSISRRRESSADSLDVSYRSNRRFSKMK
ncbi:hypothetical protein BGZ75_000435 [Mortierella antarctica]|nr:hypothetical protein BGZ67_006856 [Mortierella alpina]KAF9987543.1 hypothetical protein BGZ75_000435 [Mortierella antarctica]